MGKHLGLAALLTAALLVAACGGGSGSDIPLTGPTSGTPTTAAQPHLVVARFDFDGDTYPDILTLDAIPHPMVIVEALQGTPDGDGLDAIESWGGKPIEPEISDAIHAHLADSLQVGTETDLEIEVGGQTITVTVIE